MRTVKEIRQSFSKGSIVISRRGVFVYYNRPKPGCQWITQSMEGDYKAVFEELLNNADHFRISTLLNDGAVFCFISDREIDGDFDDAIFPRLEEELTLEELRERANGIPPNPERIKAVRKMLSDAFSGRDLSDEGDIAEGISNWVLALLEYDRPKVVSMDQYRSWEVLEGHAREFYQAFPKLGSMEFERPSKYDPSGSVTFHVKSKKNEVFDFPQNAKEFFYKMLYEADSILMETGLSDKEVFLNITFYS